MRRSWRVLVVLAATIGLVAVVVGPAQAFTRYEPTLAPTDFTFSPGAGAASGHSVVLWSTGAASAYLDATSAIHTLDFVAQAQLCEGAPHMQVAVDGVTALTEEVDGIGAYSVRMDWPAGRHKLTFRLLDDHRTATCDRNLLISNVDFFGPRQDGTDEPQYSWTHVKPQYVTVDPATAGNTTVERAKLWNNGRLVFRLDSQFGYYAGMSLMSSACGGRRGHVLVTLDDEVVYDRVPDGDVFGWEQYRFYDNGPHLFVVTLSRDANVAGCDGYVSVTGATFNGQSDLTSLPVPPPD